jgi:hypothetical protein
MAFVITSYYPQDGQVESDTINADCPYEAFSYIAKRHITNYRQHNLHGEELILVLAVSLEEDHATYTPIDGTGNTCSARDYPITNWEEGEIEHVCGLAHRKGGIPMVVDLIETYLKDDPRIVVRHCEECGCNVPSMNGNCLCCGTLIDEPTQPLAVVLADVIKVAAGHGIPRKELTLDRLQEIFSRLDKEQVKDENAMAHAIVFTFEIDA